MVIVRARVFKQCQLWTALFNPREPNWTRLKSPHTFASLGTRYYVPVAHASLACLEPRGAPAPGAATMLSVDLFCTWALRVASCARARVCLCVQVAASAEVRGRGETEREVANSGARSRHIDLPVQPRPVPFHAAMPSSSRCMDLQIGHRAMHRSDRESESPWPRPAAQFDVNRPYSPVH